MGAFNEFNVILCRNVMIYFNRSLQRRVHKLFYDSLVTFGVLGLGSKENLRLTGYEQEYEDLDVRQKLYRKRPCLEQRSQASRNKPATDVR